MTAEDMRLIECYPALDSITELSGAEANEVSEVVPTQAIGVCISGIFACATCRRSQVLTRRGHSIGHHIHLLELEGGPSGIESLKAEYLHVFHEHELSYNTQSSVFI